MRVAASLAAKIVKNRAAIAAVWPWSSFTESVSQVLADPSPSSTPSITTPITSRRTSIQPRSHCRTRTPTGGRGASSATVSGAAAGMARAIASVTTTTTTPSAMNWAEGAMPSAAQAAPIPEPTAAPTDQAACISGMSVLAAACSIAAPSTLMSTSSVPMPRPTVTKPSATSGTDWASRAPPISTSDPAIVSSAVDTAHRPPRRPSSGVEIPRPAIEPTVEQAIRIPTVGVSMLSSRISSGRRGPQVAMVTPPRPNAAMIALRQRTRVRRSRVVCVITVTSDRRGRAREQNRPVIGVPVDRTRRTRRARLR